MRPDASRNVVVPLLLVVAVPVVRPEPITKCLVAVAVSGDRASGAAAGIAERGLRRRCRGERK